LKVLVIIPFHNRANTLLATLESVANQSQSPDGVVLVDDASSDHSLAIAESWARSHEATTVLHASTNQGAAAARNWAFRQHASRYDAVCFLDSDDIWPPDFLRLTVSELSAHSDAVAASTNQIMWDVATNEMIARSLFELPAQPWLWMMKNDAGIGSCTLFRVSAVISAKGYPEHIPTGHDVILFGRLAALGSWLHVVSNESVIMRRDSRPAQSRTHHNLFHRHENHLVWWATVSSRMLLDAPWRARCSPTIRYYLRIRWRHALKQALIARQYGQALIALKGYCSSFTDYLLGTGLATFVVGYVFCE
jgi:glycosyltransferase involved in cell wall biosynthesis